MLVLPTMGANMETAMTKAKAQAKAQRDADMAKLLEKEKAAESETEKEDLRQQRLNLENVGDLELDIHPMEMFGVNNPLMIRYAMTEVISSMLLNLLMLAAGIGLVLRQEWGRKLGLGVAAFKILRLLAVYSYFALVISPLMGKGMDDFFQKAVEAQKKQAAKQGNAGGAMIGPQRPEIAKAIVVAYTGFAVAFIVLGSIYPAITLWLLSTEEARAACVSRFPSKPMREANDPWAAS
jgi:hypothetical protein